MGARHSGIQPHLINTVLPAEMLVHIFGLLPPADLRTVLLVCRLWREVGEAPGLWAWAVLRATRQNMANMPERLASRKLLRVFGLALDTGVKISEELLGAVERHPGLSRMVMKKVDLALVEPARLTGLLDRLTGITFRETQLTSEQLIAIFTNRDRTSEPWCRKKKRPLTILDLSSNDLSIIEPKLLASVVNKLQFMIMKKCHLTPQQVEVVFTSTYTASSLKCLDIGHNDLSSVEPKLLAEAVTKIQEVSLNWARLSIPQIEVVLASLNKNTKLKKLSLRGNRAAACIEPKLLVDAVAMLGELDLAFTRPTRQQACAVLRALRDSTQSMSVEEVCKEEETHLIYQFVSAGSPILLMDFSFRHQSPYHWLFTKLIV